MISWVIDTLSEHYYRCGKDRDQGNGSMGRVMDFSCSLNHLSLEKNGLFRVLQRKAIFYAGLFLYLLS